MDDIQIIRRHFEFMQADHYMTEAEYDQAAKYGLDLIVENESLSKCYEQQVELCRRLNELLENQTKKIDDLKSVLGALADEYLPCGTDGQYLGVYPKQRLLASHVNKILKQ